MGDFRYKINASDNNSFPFNIEVFNNNNTSISFDGHHEYYECYVCGIVSNLDVSTYCLKVTDNFGGVKYSDEFTIPEDYDLTPPYEARDICLSLEQNDGDYSDTCESYSGGLVVYPSPGLDDDESVKAVINISMDVKSNSDPDHVYGCINMYLINGSTCKDEVSFCVGDGYDELNNLEFIIDKSWCLAYDGYSCINPENVSFGYEYCVGTMIELNSAESVGSLPVNIDIINAEDPYTFTKTYEPKGEVILCNTYVGGTDDNVVYCGDIFLTADTTTTATVGVGYYLCVSDGGGESCACVTGVFDKSIPSNTFEDDCTFTLNSGFENKKCYQISASAVNGTSEAAIWLSGVTTSDDNVDITISDTYYEDQAIADDN